MTVVTIWDADHQIMCRVEDADVERVSSTEWVCVVGPDVVPNTVGLDVDPGKRHKPRVGLVTIHDDDQAVTKPYAIEWQEGGTVLRVIDASEYLRRCVKW